ncbi:GNAT family N-acetyltransferase [Rhizobium sp. L1K21]|uniref:GNAT family N-acetyltransferase n=1 Tax=Rhizobium sp. L1K21 TaxID=2954933 RepID=UPI0020935F38|nr:GNAT family N-acetyltransferase [Rhizobium sp. L1K21]MCO6184862.1 GNAT family N-acetyltransferase [Rhizobium sp. L1K21]
MTTLTIEVRRAEPNDAAKIAEVHRRSWEHTYAGLIPHKPLLRMLERRGQKWWANAATGPATLLVLDVAGEIAGYATVGLNRARALPHEGEIYELYLLPEYQGVGLGGRLFREAKGLLSSLGCEGLIAWCLEDSQQAVEFFRLKGGVDSVEGMEDFDDVKLKKLGFLWN